MKYLYAHTASEDAKIQKAALKAIGSMSDLLSKDAFFRILQEGKAGANEDLITEMLITKIINADIAESSKIIFLSDLHALCKSEAFKNKISAAIKQRATTVRSRRPGAE